MAALNIVNLPVFMAAICVMVEFGLALPLLLVPLDSGGTG